MMRTQTASGGQVSYGSMVATTSRRMAGSGEPPRHHHLHRAVPRVQRALSFVPLDDAAPAQEPGAFEAGAPTPRSPRSAASHRPPPGSGRSELRLIATTHFLRAGRLRPRGRPGRGGRPRRGVGPEPFPDEHRPGEGYGWVEPDQSLRRPPASQSRWVRPAPPSRPLWPARFCRLIRPGRQGPRSSHHRCSGRWRTLVLRTQREASWKRR